MNFKRTTLLHISGLFFLALSVVFYGLTFTSLKISPAKADSPTLTVYNGNLGNGWNNWSWNSTVTVSTTTPSYQGNAVISFTPNAWSGLYLHNETLVDVNQHPQLHFSIYATAANEKFGVIFYDTNSQAIGTPLPLSNYGGDPTANTWQDYSVNLSDAHTTQTKGFAIQELNGTTQPTIFLANIFFTSTNATNTVNTNNTRTAGTNIDNTSIYGDSLASDWQNWSWNSTVDFTNTGTIYEGSKSISYTPTSAWGGLYLHTDTAIDTSNDTVLRFAAKSTQANEKFAVQAFDTNNQVMGNPLPMDNYQALNGNWQIFAIPLPDLHADHKQIKGVGIFDLSGHPQATLYLDSISLSANTNTATTIQFTPQNATTQTAIISNPTASATPTTANLAPRTSSGGTGYTANNGSIYKDGNKITLHGISWFGFETSSHVVNGLWSVNWKDSITQMKSLGFNAVRIPFCPGTLQNVGVTGIDTIANPDLAGLNSMDIMDKVVNELNTQHMYILMDHHTPDCNAISHLWYTASYSEEQWIKDLQTVTARYKNLEYFMGMDLKNEPYAEATWGTGNAGTDWNTAAEKAGRAVLATDSNILIYVQGVQNNPTCSNSNMGHWQGGNFEPLNCKPLDPTAIPGDKLVLSPHVYGPDVWQQNYFSDASFPNNMPNIWDTQFGYLTNKGYTIVPGEWGGKYGTGGGNAEDVTLQNALVNYFKDKHICNSFYWDWNPNSGDTGGILQDDWKTPWSQKMQLLNTYYSGCN